MWYESLKKSKLTPPDYVFSIVWMLLYTLITLSVIIYFLQGGIHNKFAITMLLFKLVLNILWPYVFFVKKDPKLALVINIVMWISIYITMKEFAKLSQISAYLLVPYFVWVTFATYLNFVIVIKN